MDWEAFRPCDVSVEQAIAQGAYPEAFATLVQWYQGPILSYCRKRLGQVGTGGRAEDVAQDVLLKAYNLMPRKGHTPVRPWLFKIAQLYCLRVWKQATRRHALEQSHRPIIEEAVHRPNSMAPEEHILSEAELHVLRTSLVKLRKWDRVLIDTRFLQGCSIALIARDFNWSETKVRNRLDEALTRLQVIYRQLSKEP